MRTRLLPLVLLAPLALTGCNNGMLQYANAGIQRAQANGENCAEAGRRDGVAWVRQGGLVTVPVLGAVGVRDTPGMALSGVGSAAWGPAVPLVLLLAGGAAAKKQEWRTSYREGASDCAVEYGNAFGPGVNRGTQLRMGRNTLLGALIGLPIYYLSGRAKEDASSN